MSAYCEDDDDREDEISEALMEHLNSREMKKSGVNKKSLKLARKYFKEFVKGRRSYRSEDEPESFWEKVSRHLEK